MTLITKLSLSESKMASLQKLNDEKLAMSSTLNWLHKQSFNSPSLKKTIENNLAEIEQKKAKIVSNIMEEIKSKFPHAKKMALSSNFCEVKVYG